MLNNYKHVDINVEQRTVWNPLCADFNLPCRPPSQYPASGGSGPSAPATEASIKAGSGIYVAVSKLFSIIFRPFINLLKLTEF